MGAALGNHQVECYWMKPCSIGSWNRLSKGQRITDVWAWVVTFITKEREAHHVMGICPNHSKNLTKLQIPDQKHQGIASRGSRFIVSLLWTTRHKITADSFVQVQLSSVLEYATWVTSWAIYLSSPTYSTGLFLFCFVSRISLSLAVLKLAIQTRWVLKSQRYAYLYLPSAEIKSLSHHAQISGFLWTAKKII